MIRDQALFLAETESLDKYLTKWSLRENEAGCKHQGKEGT